MEPKKLLNFMVFVVLASLLLNGCVPAAQATLPVTTSETQPGLPIATNIPGRIAEVETLAGFDVKEPAYLPAEASFNFAAYQSPPYPNVTLHFNYGEMGSFFQIVQEPLDGALPDPNACGLNGDECETLQAGGFTVKYRLTEPTETLMWEADGFAFRLLRMSGEPGKIYKDELLKVVESMQ